MNIFFPEYAVILLVLVVFGCNVIRKPANDGRDVRLREGKSTKEASRYREMLSKIAARRRKEGPKT